MGRYLPVVFVDSSSWSAVKIENWNTILLSALFPVDRVDVRDFEVVRFVDWECWVFWGHVG